MSSSVDIPAILSKLTIEEKVSYTYNLLQIRLITNTTLDISSCGQELVGNHPYPIQRRPLRQGLRWT